MIRVTLPLPPGNYVADVLTPGAAFLVGNPHPVGDDWLPHRYWSRIHGHLHTELQGICAYCAAFTPRRAHSALVDHSSIDHYIPKSRPPHTQAYDWTNFRLARARLNHRKGNHLDVLDPCTVTNGWFRLDFVTFAVAPDPGLSAADQQRVRKSIERLELNQDDAYVNERARAVYGYADGQLPVAELRRLYPFIAAQMAAQNFDAAHLPRFQGLLASPRFRVVLMRQGWVA